MTRINTNVASLRGLRSLNNANNKLDSSLTRLSTGLKINSGKDNPSGLIASETLRSQISAIEQSIKNSGRANNVIATADAALGEVGNLLNQVRGLVQESLNDGALSQSEIEANQLQIDAALSAINRISSNTQFAGDKLIDGSKAFVTKLTSADSAKLQDFQVNEALFSASSTVQIEAEITQQAEKAELRFTDAALTQAATVEVAGSRGSQVVFLGSSSSKADIRDAINSLTDVTGVSATFDPGATFELGATQGFTDIGSNSVKGTAAIGATTTAQISFTAESAGAASTVGAVEIEFDVAGSSTNATTVVVSDITGGKKITVTLAANTGGTITGTYSDVKAALDGTTITSTLVDVTVAGGSTAAVTSGGAVTVSGGVDAGFLKINDARNNGSGGSVATLGGEVFVQVADFATGTTTASLGVNSFSVDSETGNVTVQIQLAKTAGAVTSTVNDVSSFINTTTTTVTVNGSAVELNDFISAENSSSATSSSVLSSAGSLTQLLGGTDGNNNDITFNDARSYGTAGQVRIAFADPSTSGGSLSVSVADVSGTSDKLVTFSLATDANGNITTTADDIKNLIETGTSAGAVAARDLVNLEIEGDGSELIKAAPAAGTLTVDVASRILKLQSEEYGADEFVQINVIAGAFDTKLNDNVSIASRDAGQDLQAVINGQVAETRGLAARIKNSTLDASLAFNETNNVVGRRAVVTVTGGGSTFQIGQDASAAGQIGIGIEAVNTARLGGISGKLYELGTGGGKNLLDISPDTPGSLLVDIVEESIDRVSTLRGRLGAIQRNVIDTNINTLGIALENISEARSVITDTDFATATADLTKAQILNQAGISVLSIANQNPQQVLSLLG